MYVPAHFLESDLTTLHDFVEQHSFGLLVSQVDGLTFASLFPCCSIEVAVLTAR